MGERDAEAGMSFLECMLISIGIGCAFLIGAYVGPNPSDYKKGKDDPEYKYDMSIWTAYNDGGGDANAAYDIAMDQYRAQQLEYEDAMDKINKKTEEIHEKDQVLELQLRQLDTEQETIVTELESVKKVIDKNIENVFKTFQS